MEVLAWVLGLPEVIVIGVLVLLLFGTRLPVVGRSLGSAIVQFRRAIKGEEETDTDEKPNERPSAK
jgi:TatA/E family protein of Tat protein translocase